MPIIGKILLGAVLSVALTKLANKAEQKLKDRKATKLHS